MERERKRRVVREEAPAKSSGLSVSMKVTGLIVLLIVGVVTLQFVLLMRHGDVSHRGVASPSIENAWQAKLAEQDLALKAFVIQQKDMLRISSQLSSHVQKQQQEIQEMEAKLALLGGSGSSPAAVPGPSVVDTASASKVREDEILNLQREVERMKAQAADKAGDSKNFLPTADNAKTQDDVAAAEEELPNLGSDPADGFPSDWLEHFSREELEASAKEAEAWRDTTRKAFLHAWRGYHDHAWGADEFNPTSGRHARTWANCGMQILDALSTLWIMDLKTEFDEGTAWVEKNLKWNHRGLVSVFETTIRALGGLVSAHSLSGRDVFLQKAKELADRLLPAFRGEAGFPTAQVDLQTGTGRGGWYQGTLLAEAGTVQLEFRYISQQTGDKKYAKAVDMSMRSIIVAARGRGLVPWGLSGSGPPHATNQHITFGAMGDSYYEYLLKMWMQTSKSEPEWKDEWKNAMNKMEERLILKTSGGLTYVAEEKGGRIDHKMDHLACFVGGMLIYGARTLPKNEVDARWEETAAGITETCYQMYHRQPSHLAPECVSLRPDAPAGRDMEVWQDASHYLLRPEAAEAIFYMFYYTGDPKYRRMAWEIMQAIEEHTKTTFGYSAVRDVRSTRPQLRNEMETFFLAETLKYLYLTFLPNPRKVLSLEEYVFNTEAHPIRIAKGTAQRRPPGFLQ
eukprot:TRINITY_DN62869_c0_g1_i1.p1 TRINITY_DN62869_c0_g1~~TRINITY_DN62869_c0_g1_i1.p1  ORF type:complete len:709 (-),score=118.70 TRINITY_DN62869_c0_g1_i1:75-2123(-)